MLMTMTTRARMPAQRRATRVTTAIATMTMMPVHQWQLRLCIGNGDNTASREAAALREAEAVQRDATQQPAGANKNEGSRMDAFSSCTTK